MCSVVVALFAKVFHSAGAGQARTRFIAHFVRFAKRSWRTEDIAAVQRRSVPDYALTA